MTKSRMSVRMVLLVFAFAWCAPTIATPDFLGCGGLQGPANPPGTQGPDSFGYEAEVIYTATKEIHSMLIGEFDPAHPGQEAAMLLSDGSVWELVWIDGVIDATQIATPINFPDQFWGHGLPTISLGDVDAASEGLEIVGNTGLRAFAIRHDPTQGWVREIIEDFSQFGGFGWRVRSGDIDPAHPGEEVVFFYEGFFDSGFANYYRKVGDSWSLESERFYVGPVVMDFVIADINPNHPGNEIFATAETDDAFEIIRPAPPAAGEWPRRVVWSDAVNVGLVAKVADVDPAIPGNEIVLGTRNSTRIGMSWDCGDVEHGRRLLFTGEPSAYSDNLVEIAVADILPESESMEILGTVASGAVYLLQKIGDDWVGNTIFTAEPGYYYTGVAVGELLSDRPGLEILVGGEARTLRLLSRPQRETGDLNCDGTVDLDDLPGFATALVAPDDFDGCDIALADTNADGQIDGRDIDDFITRVIGE